MRDSLSGNLPELVRVLARVIVIGLSGGLGSVYDVAIELPPSDWLVDFLLNIRLLFSDSSSSVMVGISLNESRVAILRILRLALLTCFLTLFCALLTRVRNSLMKNDSIIGWTVGLSSKKNQETMYIQSGIPSPSVADVANVTRRSGVHDNMLTMNKAPNTFTS